MNIADKLVYMSGMLGDTTAIIEGSRIMTKKISFSALNARSDACAERLLEHGVSRGDPVLVMHPVSIELYVFMIALFKIGAVAVFLDPSFGPEHIARAFELCRPHTAFVSAKMKLLFLVNSELRRIRTFLSPDITRGTINQRPRFTSVALSTDAPALITLTSGSTGAPKAIVRSHNFLLGQLEILTKTLSLKPGERDLTTLPIFVLANIACGVTSILPSRRVTAGAQARSAVRQIEEHRVTRISAAPEFLKHLTRRCSVNGIKLPNIKIICTGGGPVFPNLLLELPRMAPTAKIRVIFGSTECEPIACIDFDRISSEDLFLMFNGGGLLAGPVCDHTEVRLVDPKTNLPVAPGAVGEILVTGDHVIKSYLRGIGNGETKVLLDGEIWHRTGDCGYFDERGRLWLVGRQNATIIDRDGVLYPLQVESALSGVAGIERSACISDSQKRVLFVETAKALSATECSAVLKQKLEWAMIEEIVVVRHLPVDKRHRSKIDYPALNKLIRKSSAA